MSEAEFKCVDCRAVGPTSSEEVTRASSLGWRLRLVATPDGQQKMEWRCPRCWVAYKVKEGSASHEAIKNRRR